MKFLTTYETITEALEYFGMNTEGLTNFQKTAIFLAGNIYNLILIILIGTIIYKIFFRIWNVISSI